MENLQIRREKAIRKLHTMSVARTYRKSRMSRKILSS